jgi:nitrite reductase/ring-hydroxylating ferredoxin subunit
MVQNLKYLVFFVLLVIGLLNFSCKKSSNQNTQTNATIVLANNTPLNIQVYLSAHPSLNAVGGVDTISNVGIKGLIIYHASAGFYAYERACTYDGTTNAGAKIALYNTFSARCPACGSVYTIADGSGSVTHSPATFALKQYTVNFDASSSILHITN